MQAKCPACTTLLNIPDHLAGKPVKCQCGKVFRCSAPKRRPAVSQPAKRTAAKKSFRITCPKCSRTLGLNKKQLGTAVNCPHCNAKFWAGILNKNAAFGDLQIPTQISSSAKFPVQPRPGSTQSIQHDTASTKMSQRGEIERETNLTHTNNHTFYLKEAESEIEFEARMKAVDNHILNKLNKDLTPGVDANFLFHVFNAVLLPFLLTVLLGFFAAPVFWLAAFRYATKHDEHEIAVIYLIAGCVPILALYLAPGTFNLLEMLLSTWSLY